MSRVLSGQITVTTAGTAVAGTNVEGKRFALKAHHSNTGVMWVGNDGAGDVTNNNGFPLSAGNTVEVYLDGLSALIVDASVNGEKLCWYRVE